MAGFSERNGYVQPKNIVYKEMISTDLANSLCTCYDILQNNNYENYKQLEQYLWTEFLHERLSNFHYGYMQVQIVATNILLSDKHPWYKKFDLIEKSLIYLRNNYNFLERDVDSFVQNINHYFEELNYGYRIVDDIILPISSEEEKEIIDNAINSSKNNIKAHLHTALILYSKRPDADYRNSIKESISAVEAFCREQTDESTLGGALNKLKDKGIVIPEMMKTAFNKLYAYTCQPTSGIRHALMDEEGTYIPQQEEAMFMLVSCSAFINYNDYPQLTD